MITLEELGHVEKHRTLFLLSKFFTLIKEENDLVKKFDTLLLIHRFIIESYRLLSETRFVLAQIGVSILIFRAVLVGCSLLRHVSYI